MIVPKSWLEDKEVIDKNQLAMGSESYKTQSGLKIFSQNKKDYSCFLKDLDEYNQSLE